MSENMWAVAGAVVELTNILLCYAHILKAPMKGKKKRIAIAYAFVVLCEIINVYSIRIDQGLFVIMMCILMLPYIMKEDKLKWTKWYPCAYMMSSIINIMFSFIIVLFMGIPQSDSRYIPGFGVIANSLFSVVILVSVLYKMVRRKKSNGAKMYWNNRVYLFIMIGSFMFYGLIGMIQYIGGKYEIPSNQTNLLGIFVCGAGIVLFLLFIWLSTTMHQNEEYLREKDMLNLYVTEQEKYIKMIVTKDEDMRRFRHDIRHNMWIVSTNIKSGKYDNAREYIEKIYGKLDEVDVVQYSGIEALDAVINNAKMQMQKKNVRLKWSGNLIGIRKSLDVYDLCTVFINILNNALDAVEDLENDRVVEVKVSNINNLLHIVQDNKFVGERRLDEKGCMVTSKEDKGNHGLGSKNIRNVVDKYNGRLKYVIKENNFHVEIDL